MTAPVILIEAQPSRAADGVAETVRLAGAGADKPYRYLGQDWRAGVARLPTWIAALEFQGGDLGLGGIPAAAEIEWAPARSADVAALAAYYWTDAPITIRVGPEGADPPIERSGKVLEATVADGVLKLALADPAADIKKPFPVERFLGTGGLEGPAEWEGLMRRRVWGRVWNQPGQPIDKANNVYCLADPLRQISAIDAVLDKGAAAAALTTLAWQGSAAATFTALQAAAAPQGGGVIAPSIACVKWWTRPAGDLTADLKGEIGAGYVETAAEIAQRVVSAAGGPAFTAGTVAAAAAARPGPAGWALRDDNTTTATMLDDLLGAVSLLWLLDAAGAITIRQWAWGASVATAKSLGAMRKRAFKPLATRKLGYKRNELPMARGDLAGIVFDAAYADGTPIDNLKPADTGATRNQYYVQAADPGAVPNGSLWKKTGITPPIFYLRSAGAWVDVSSLVTDTSQIADGAGLGLTALWSNIAGQANAPESNSTRNQYFISATDPIGSNGSLWKDTSTTPARFKLKVSGSWVDVSSLVTDTAQITDGAQLGLTAVWSGVSGGGKPDSFATSGDNMMRDPNFALTVLREGRTLSGSQLSVVALPAGSPAARGLKYASGAHATGQTHRLLDQLDGSTLYPNMLGGQTYYFGLLHKATRISGTAPFYVTLYLDFFDAAGSLLGGGGSVTPAPNGVSYNATTAWAWSEGSITAPAGAISARMRLDLGNQVDGVGEFDWFTTGLSLSRTQLGATVGTPVGTTVAGRILDGATVGTSGSETALNIRTRASRLSTSSGQALSNFIASDGRSYGRIVGGFSMRDDQAFTFAAALPEIPKITFLPGGIGPGAGKNIKVVAENLTVSGFTLRAKEQTVSPGTTYTDTTVTSGGAGEPTQVINRSNGNAPYDGKFTFRLSTTVGNIAPGEPGYVEVALFLRQAGAWVQVSTAYFTASASVNDVGVFGSCDYGAGSEFGMSILASEGAGSTASLSHVRYTDGTVTETTLTPAGSSDIPFIAMLQ